MRSHRTFTPWFLSAALLILCHALHAYPVPNPVVPSPEPPLPGYFDTFNPPVGGAVGAPVLAEWNRMGGPDDAINLTGANLNANFVAWGQTSNATNAIAFTAANQPNSQESQLMLPAGLPAHSMYFVWPVDAGGQAWGNPAAINQTELWWVGPNQAASGDATSAYGRNFFYGGLTPTVWIGVQNTGFQQATVLAYSPGKIDFIVPTTFNGQSVSPGQIFQVWVHNAHGGHYGWSGPQTLTVQAGQNYGGQQTVPGPIPGGDDTANIENAINAAQNSGNKVVQLASGTYHVSSALTASGICVQGQGPNLTTLTTVSGSNPSAIFNAVNAVNLSIAAMTIDGSSFSPQTGAVLFLRNNINLHCNNLTVLSGTNILFDTLNSQYVYLGNCGMQGPGSYFGNASQVFINGGTDVIEGLNGNMSSFMIFRSGSAVSVCNVTAAANPNNPCMGRFILFQGYDTNSGPAYVGNNTTSNLAVGPGISNQNSGEQVLWEGFQANETGQANGGDSTHITIPSSANYASGYSISIQKGTGLGQVRRIVGQQVNGGSSTLTVSPAWNVAPDSSSTYEVGLFFSQAYCYANQLQGMSDYATRDTASCGFEPYSGVTQAVFDSNNLNQCRSGINVFSITDPSRCSTDGSAVQPDYWIDFANNVVSNSGWGSLILYSDGCGNTGRNAAADLGVNVAYNSYTNISAQLYPDNPPISGGVVLDAGNDTSGLIDLTAVHHNCFSATANPMPAPIGNVQDTFYYGNATGGCPLVTPTPPPTCTPLPTRTPTPLPTLAGSPTVTPTVSSTPTSSQTWTTSPTPSITATATPTVTLTITATATPTPTAVPTLPCPWQQADIGTVGIAGSASVSSGTFTVSGSGGDNMINTDSFHFVYQPMAGDLTIVSRVVSVQNGDGAAMGGVEVRQDFTATSVESMITLTPGGVAQFIRRASAGTAATVTSSGTFTPPYWVKLVRSGNTFSSFVSPDGVNWTASGSDTVAMTGTVYVGLLVYSHNNSVLDTDTFDNVSVVGNQLGSCLTATPTPSPTPSQTPTPTPVGTIPCPWQQADVGSVGIAGSAGYGAGTFTVQGSGADIYGNPDSFHFVYQPMTGDVTIIARVVTLQNTNSVAKAGVMIRQDLTAGSVHALVDEIPGTVTEFIRRLTAGGGPSISTASGAVPYWVKLVRSGSTFTAYASADGSSWTLVGSDSITMSGTVYVGLVVCSHDNSQLNTATFDNVSVQGITQNQDVVAVGLAGSSSYASGTYSIIGSGSDIFGTADAFQFAYQAMTGDVTITARVASVQNTNSVAKAGVEIRQDFTAGSVHALVDEIPGTVVEYIRRTSANGTSSVSTVGGNVPYWVRLIRSGNQFTAYASADGSNWVQVGTDTVAMSGTVYVGLAVCSHNNSALNTSTFDNVSILGTLACQGQTIDGSNGPITIQSVRPAGNVQQTPGPALGASALLAAPDPASDQVTAFWQQDAQAVDRIQLYSLTGVEVLSQNLGRLNPGGHQVRLDTAGVPSGIFLLHLGLSDGTGRSRWVKVAIAK